MAVDVDMSEVNKYGLSKVKSDVGDIKSMMNEIMQIQQKKIILTKEITDEY